MSREFGGRWNGMALLLHRTLSGKSLEEVRREMEGMGYPVSMSTIARWERGERSPRRSELAEALATIFRCSVLAFYRQPRLTYDAANEDD